MAMMGSLRLALPATVGALSASTVLETSSESHHDNQTVALRRRLTPLGKTSLLTEADSNRSIPMFFLRIRGHLDRQELISLLNSKLTSCERFSSRIEISHDREDAHFVNLAKPVVSTDGQTSMVYDVSDHVKPLYVGNNIEGREPTEAEKYEGLRSFLASIANTPVDMPTDKPQWEMLITQPVSTEDKVLSTSLKTNEANNKPISEEETLIIFRIHHALADGVSVAALLSSLTDEGEDLFKALLGGKNQKKEGKGKAGANKKSKSEGKKQGGQGVFNKLGKMVKLLMKILGGITAQFVLLPFLLFKYVRMTGRSVLFSKVALFDQNAMEILTGSSNNVEGDWTILAKAFFNSSNTNRVTVIGKWLRQGLQAMWATFIQPEINRSELERHMRYGLFGNRGNLGTSRLVAWSSTPLNQSETEKDSSAASTCVALNPLKLGLKKHTPKATVNDAVLAAIASSLGYFTDKGSDAPTFLTAVVPVNLRPLLAVLTGNIPNVNAPLSEQIKMLQGNKIGGLLFDLPLRAGKDEPSDIVEVIKATSKTTGWCKLMPESLVAYLLATVSGYLAVDTQKSMQYHAIGQADLAVSNVRGPDDIVHVCGKPVEQLVGFLPPPNGCPLGVAVTSYRGVLQISVNADENAMKMISNDENENGAQLLLAKVEEQLQSISLDTTSFKK